eukprot:CAMPEP_0178395178 /NCGR_PEP_ID=MMETSP0689_2-20121128/13085_1 /TAXON_ID=160604 /ORGANISM="Amphidinium massartii, Strain CS-259" /LENGTH=74 /DNA_ID=CAMNT_0020015825 /DNA_START=708 /DNA_END=932 /DNA_ORIENTATION=-
MVMVTMQEMLHHTGRNHIPDILSVSILQALECHTYTSPSMIQRRPSAVPGVDRSIYLHSKQARQAVPVRLHVDS